MFVGHTAVALAARRRTPGLSLGYLLTAAYALDLLWPIFLLAGVETVSIVPGATAFNPLQLDSYPWSHSLAMSIVWGLCAYALARWYGRSASVGWWLAALVVSHWVLDAASHAPDMPLWPGPSPKLGLGLWYSVPASLLVEGALFAGGIWYYLRGTTVRSRAGSAIFWAFVLVSTVLWASGPWSPPPPSPQALAYSAFGAWLFIAWAAWADRYRLEPALDRASSNR